MSKKPEALTKRELQTLRNLGNEAEAAADEIERLGAEVECLSAEVERLRAALQDADTIMGHDDAETEWRDKWAHLWSAAREGGA